jgi:hypothetical protein
MIEAAADNQGSSGLPAEAVEHDEQGRKLSHLYDGECGKAVSKRSP